jgi:hypothetical protein
MNLATSIDGLALYGSMLRGDFDEHSDRDLLIVADQQAEWLNDVFSSAGYSPTVYSWRQLEGLSKEGSLFIQHLKQESKVLKDKNGQLHELLSCYEPKDDYTSRLLENRNLFEMTSGVSATSPAVSWAFDVLAVAFRNHAILQCAQRKAYIFSYGSLVREMAYEFDLHPTEVELLLELRTRKSQYRVHPTSVTMSMTSLKRTQALLEKMFHVDCLSQNLAPRDFVSKLLGETRVDLHWYYRLRRAEGAYRSMGFVPSHDGRALFARIERVFGKPSPYGSGGSSAIDWVEGQVRSIASQWSES